MSEDDNQEQDPYDRLLNWAQAYDIARQIARTLIENARTGQPKPLDISWLVSQKDGRGKELAGSVYKALAETLAHRAGLVVVSGGLAMAPMGLGRTVIDVAPPLPADLIMTSMTVAPSPDYARAGMLMLMVMAWLVMFVLPVLIQASGMSSDAKMTFDTEVGIVAALAAPVTIEILKKERE